MKRLAFILALTLLLASCAGARKAASAPAAEPAEEPVEAQAEASEEDKYAPLDSLLARYYLALEQEDIPTKIQEVDFLISSSRDSLTRQHVALAIYDHYVDSRVMGEEEVAIHVYDRWFASGEVPMRGEFDRMAADIFAEFNRHTLLGAEAPVLSLYDPEGRKVSLPSTGRTSILYFYDTSCSKCKIEAGLLPGALRHIDFDLDFYAVYSGSNAESWAAFRDSFLLDNPHIRLIHLWDPELESDYLRMYGVMSTPRIYVTEPGGVIIGRRLEADSLVEVLKYAGAIQAVYQKNNQNQ